jgi:hypothetical protein
LERSTSYEPDLIRLLSFYQNKEIRLKTAEISLVLVHVYFLASNLVHPPLLPLLRAVFAFPEE